MHEAKKSELFRKINLVDAAALLLIFLLVCLVLYKVLVPEDKTSEDYLVIFKINNQKQEIYDNIKSGDKIFNYDKSLNGSGILGVVVNSINNDSSRNLVVFSRLQVKSNNDGWFFFNDQQLLIGKQIDLVTNKISVYATILDLVSTEDFDVEDIISKYVSKQRNLTLLLLKLDNLPSYVYDGLKPDDMILDDDIRYDGSKVLGVYETSTDSDKTKDFAVLALVESLASEKGIRFNSQDIRVGSQLSLNTLSLSLRPYVMGIFGKEERAEADAFLDKFLTENSVSYKNKTVILKLSSVGLILDDLISEGSVYTENNMAFAVIKSKYAEHPKVSKLLDDGTVIFAEDKLKYDIVLQLDVVAEERDDKYYFQDKLLVKGKTISFELDDLVLDDALIVSVD